MNIKIYLQDIQGNNINGIVQIHDMADSTEDGVGTFNLEKGVYKARGIAYGHRVILKEINVEYEGQEFTLLAIRG